LALIVGLQPLFLAALSILLEGEPLNATALTASRSDTALQMLAEHEPHIVFCDVRCGPMPWTAVAAATSAPVALLADPEDETQLHSALGSSAAGFFTKDVGLDQFLAGVEAILAGHIAISANILRGALARIASDEERESQSTTASLSATELQILTMLGQAGSIAAIAASCGVSAKTVRSHIASIYRKLHFNSRAEAVVWAVTKGLTNVPLEPTPGTARQAT
jgi:DNA-binding NarL/FixJ family response regulator